MRSPYKADIRRYQREKEPGVLIGMRHICRYMEIGHHKLTRFIQDDGFPATMLPDGRWCTSKKLIDDWIIHRWKMGKEAIAKPMQGDRTDENLSS